VLFSLYPDITGNGQAGYTIYVCQDQAQALYDACKDLTGEWFRALKSLSSMLARSLPWQRAHEPGFPFFFSKTSDFGSRKESEKRPPINPSENWTIFLACACLPAKNILKKPHHSNYNVYFLCVLLAQCQLGLWGP